MGKFRRIFSNRWRYSFSLSLLFSSLSCFSQIITTRPPYGILMTPLYGVDTTYDHAVYVFWLNNENKSNLSLAMSFTNDTIHISPHILNIPKPLFRAVVGHELAHYYNYVLHGEIIKADTSKKYVDPVDWGTPPDLTKIVYKGGDGSSPYIRKAILIKHAATLKEGIAAEYAYLDKKLGQRGINWKPLGQYLFPAYKYYCDVIKVKIIDTNEIKYFCFNITDVFGKF